MRKLRIFGMAVVLCATAGVAFSQPPVVTNPEWVRKPTQDVMDSYLPPKAMQEGKSGKATLKCSVTTAGLLHRCAVTDESPAGYGVGEAALMMSKFFQMKPRTVNGNAVESEVSIPFNFVCGGCRQTEVKTRRHFANAPWLSAPTFEQWKAAYPAKAQTANVSGSASLECKFRREGALTDCRVLSETPRSMGFGAAAKSLTTLFRGIAVDGDGLPTENATVSLNIAWPRDAVTAERAKGSPPVFRTPASADLANAFPAAASAEGLTQGRAIVACTLADGGELTGCRIASEIPAAKGFGQSALTVAPKVRYSLWSSDGMPVPRSISVPLSFQNGPKS